MLRPIDILLTLRILVSGPDSFANLGKEIGVSASQAHAASRRAVAAGILRPDLSVRKVALLETLLAIKYYVLAKRGGEVRGIPTAHAAPMMKEIISGDEGRAPVWPHPEGSTRGLACEPIYKTAPTAALRNLELYEYLAVIDSLRIGSAREQQWAKDYLTERLGH